MTNYENCGFSSDFLDLHNNEIEAAIQTLEHDNSQENVITLIQLLQERSLDRGKLFVPVMDTDELEEPGEDLFQVDKMSVDSLSKPQEPRSALPRKVELFKGGVAFTAFTSVKELEKGENTKYTSMAMKDFFEYALEDEECVGIVMNPWDISVLLDKQILRMILYTPVRGKYKSTLYVEKGDITQSNAEAVVNAANTRLEPGSGVCGAIFDAAGDELISACKELGGCATGEAKITPGFHMKADYIIHTPGPVYTGRSEDDRLLASCYYNALELARQNDIHSIAFPAISTGIYGYPLEKAVPISVVSVSAWIRDHPDYDMDITLMCFDDRTFDAYNQFVRPEGEEPISKMS